MTTRRWFATCGSYYGVIQRRVSEDLVNSYRLRFCNVRIYTAMSEFVQENLKKLLLII